MQKFIKLSRAEMKNLVGGETSPACGDCIECFTDSDCTDPKWPRCLVSTCPDGKTTGDCVIAD